MLHPPEALTFKMLIGTIILILLCTAVSPQTADSITSTSEITSVSTADPPVKCEPRFDNLKGVKDLAKMTVNYTWNSNNTSLCNYAFNVTVTTRTTSSEEIVLQSMVTTETNYTATNIQPCTMYNFTVKMIELNDNKTLFALSEILKMNISEADNIISDITYVSTTNSISLRWTPSRYAIPCNITYNVTVTDSDVEGIPYNRMETFPNHTIGSLNSCSYYNVTIRPMTNHQIEENHPLIIGIATLPENVTSLDLSSNGSEVVWQPPSNQKCIKEYQVIGPDFAKNVSETHFKSNQSLFCAQIIVTPIAKDNRTGIAAEITKPGGVGNVKASPLKRGHHERMRLDWEPPANKSCVHHYLVKEDGVFSKYVPIDTSTSITTTAISNLTACTRYKVQLFAATERNLTGDPYDFVFNTLTSPYDIDPVENLTETVNDKIVTLRWNPPANARACNLTYKIEVYKDDEVDDTTDNIIITTLPPSTVNFLTKITAETTLTVNLTDVVYCAPYKLSVTARVLSKSSHPNQLSIQIPQVRTAPTCTVLNASSTYAAIECKMTDAYQNLCPIDRLTVSCNEIYPRVVESPKETEEVILDGLKYHSNYTCQAVNIFGKETSESKEFIVNTDQGVPDSPDRVEIKYQTNTSFQISWDNVKTVRGILKNYRVQVKCLSPTYYASENRCITVGNVVDSVEVGKNTTYVFFSAFPSYMYEVTVEAASGYGYGPPSDPRRIYTNGGIPEEPRDTNFKFINYTQDGNYNGSVTVSWMYPRFTHGNVSHFWIEVVGKSIVDDQVDGYRVETNVTLNTPISNEHYEHTVIDLKPAFEYEIHIKVINLDGFESAQETLKFNSSDSLPEAPTIKTSLTEINETAFTMTWDPPKRKNGFLKMYVVHVEENGPLYLVPNECEQNDQRKQSLEYQTPPTSTSYTYTKGRPYHGYNVTIWAVNSIGLSPKSEVCEFQTLEAASEKVRNLTLVPNAHTVEYNAPIKITFDHPCNTFGDVEYFEIMLMQVAPSNKLDKAFIMDASETVRPYELNFTGLHPETSYEVLVGVKTKKYYSTQARLVFNTNAGIPPPSKKIAVHILQNSGTATFTLSKNTFDETNGRILYYSLILREGTDENDDPMPTYGTWDESDIGWYEVANNLTEVNRATFYSVTPKFWNPFTGNNLTDYTIPLSDSSRPLSPSTTYTLKVRGFTRNGWRDSENVTFKIPDEPKLGLILGLTFGILGTLTGFFLIFVIWKRRQNWSKKKDSIKSIPLTPIPITISNFTRYYSDLQENAEKLKLEFTLLAKKSGEIVATCDVAIQPENKKKNRYTNILPYDDSRVKLYPMEKEEEGNAATTTSLEDYINASYIKGYSGTVEYIATQGPLEHTVTDFWRMVTQENSSLIVMVAQFVEQNKDKCYKYFPNVHENMELDNGLEVRCCTELGFKNHVVRTFMIQKDMQQWTVTHLQFTDWPDFGCPVGTDIIIEFCQLMREHAERNQDPIIIHCSAGVGRTGTLIALDILLQAIASKSDIDVFGTVLNLRMDRKNMVQTEKQYLFIHNCVDDVINNPSLMSTKEEIISKEPIYENFDGIKNGNYTQESKF